MTYWSLLVLTLFLGFLGVAQEGTVTLYHSGSFVGYGRVVEISRDEQAAALDLDLDDTPDQLTAVASPDAPKDFSKLTAV